MLERGQDRILIGHAANTVDAARNPHTFARACVRAFARLRIFCPKPAIVAPRPASPVGPPKASRFAATPG
jgi:hypothetical protein